MYTDRSVDKSHLDQHSLNEPIKVCIFTKVEFFGPNADH